MKKMIVAVLASCLAVSAFAAIGVEWSASNMGIFLHDTSGDDVTAYDTLALGQSSLFWQLLFSPDGAKDDIDLTNAAGGYVSGDDQVLADRTIAKDTSGNWDGIVAADDETSWMTCGINMGGEKILYVDEGWGTAGNIYQRVFAGTPAEGVWYFESDLVALSLGYNAMDPSSTQVFSIDTESKGAILGLQIPGGSQVPEPATMSLLGLGALGMVLRRKLRK